MRLRALPLYRVFGLIWACTLCADPWPRHLTMLPPTYRNGNTDRQKYANIGESDRMTLKFVKS